MTDVRTKKLINAPEDIIAEAIEGGWSRRV